ncbi:DUF5789 family protein [Halocatena halophila]|uniref:DUF5789 family protein n=1 Tax=Halocatena halophila TaxID=2814576 RepID=UPI002ED478C9
MADTDEESEPAVELGRGPPVEGAPLARITSRLHYGIPKSEVVRREGDSAIRTADGPQDLADVLADIDETYFPREQDLTDAIRSVIGDGPVVTAEE